MHWVLVVDVALREAGNKKPETSKGFGLSPHHEE
jgi:hypothetical protein